jgi:hypothetical protein
VAVAGGRGKKKAEAAVARWWADGPPLARAVDKEAEVAVVRRKKMKRNGEDGGGLCDDLYPSHVGYPCSPNPFGLEVGPIRPWIG